MRIEVHVHVCGIVISVPVYDFSIHVHVHVSKERQNWLNHFMCLQLLQCRLVAALPRETA